MKKNSLYAIPVVLCAVAVVLLVVRNRRATTPPPVRPVAVAAPAPQSAAATPAVTVPAATPAAKKTPVATAASAPTYATPQAELNALKKAYEALLVEKQRLLDSVKAADLANSQLTEAKSVLEETLAQLKRDRQNDSEHFAASSNVKITKLQADLAEVTARLKSLSDELAPLKARETARQEALKKVPAPVVINP